MKTAICAIGRLENQYAKEFVEHHLSLGFNKIFIYDNNQNGEEHFEEVLQDLIEQDKVEIINFRNKTVAQLPAYNDCYNKHNQEYDFIAFIDFDEFIILENNHQTIQEYLEDKSDFDCILLNWMVMDDNDLVHNDKKPLMERFTRPMSSDKRVSYSFPENNHVKSIVKGNIENLKFTSNPHIPSTPIRCCNAEGKRCDQSPWHPYTFKNAYIKHFTTKTITEWVENKMKRGTADRTYKRFIDGRVIQHFFKINERTPEKEEIAKNVTE